MTRGDRRRLGDRAHAHMLELGPQFVERQIDDVARACLSERADTIQKRPPGKGRLGAERERPNDVETAADAAVDHHGRS